MAADRCIFTMLVPEPPPPPTGDFFMIAVSGATYKSLDDRADYGISAFLGMTKDNDFQLQTGNNGIFTGFHKYQFTDYLGNGMNGYPVFIRDNDPGNVIYDFHNNGSKLVVGRTPIGGGTRAYQLDAWLDQNVHDWSIYTSQSGQFTRGTDGNNLIFSLPQPTASNKPYIRRSLNGSMGRVLTDGDPDPGGVASSDYQIRGLKEIMMDPHGHMYSRCGSSNYYGYQIADTLRAALNKAVSSNWPLQWMVYTPDYDGWVQYKMYYTGSSPGGSTSQNGSGSQGFAAPYKSGGGPGGGGSPDSYWPIINYRGDTFLVYQYGTSQDYDEYGRIAFYKILDTGTLSYLFSHYFDPLQGGSGLLNFWTQPNLQNPIVLADNTICFIGRGGYGNPKSILYGDPDNGSMTYLEGATLNDAPFRGLLDPSVSFTNNIQRCRRFNLPF